jgi:hypothetical protein
MAILFGDLKQVHARSLNCRWLRLVLIAGSAIAAAAPVFAVADQPSQTTLVVDAVDHGAHTQAMLQVNVTGEDGSAVSGAVAIEDNGKPVAGSALDAEGHARLTLDLAGGDHLLRAVYEGDAAHLGSNSEPQRVHALSGTTPDFSVSVSPTRLSLPLGQSGSVKVTVTPANNASLTAPMFITLSCQGLPDESSCTFTPENVEILSNTPATCNATACPPTSTMVVETQLGTGKLAKPALSSHAMPVLWAVVVPGALGLMGLARRRGWPQSFIILAFLGVVCTLGSTACNSRYNYYNHGPPPNPPTPAGTYTLTVSAQSNNGITAITHTTTMVLTVQ